MRNSYKDAYNEWACQIYDETGSYPGVIEEETFRGGWVDDLYDRADEARKEARENPDKQETNND